MQNRPGLYTVNKNIISSYFMVRLFKSLFLYKMQKLRPKPRAIVSKTAAKFIQESFVLTERINIFWAELSSRICHCEEKIFLN